MFLEETNIRDNAVRHRSVMSDMLDGSRIGLVIRDFFSPDEVAEAIRVFRGYPFPMFEPADGYCALPRPFGGVLGPDDRTEGYGIEVNYLHKSSEMERIRLAFLSRISMFCGGLRPLLADGSQGHTLSQSWLSMRELRPDQGSFELHCGNYFVGWNRRFFDHQDRYLVPGIHLAFLSMLVKPENGTDLILYDLHWKDASDRIDQETVRDCHGNTLFISGVPSYQVSLSPGDMVIFDESNYWHRVPRFSGSSKRLTMGGFISPRRGTNEMVFWA